MYVQIESNRKYNSMQRSLRRHDIAALAERRRRNVVTTPSFEGCRCYYDPNSDGHGEYSALVEFREHHPKTEQLHQSMDDRKVYNESTCESENDSDDEFDYLLDEEISGEDHGLKELEENRRAELEFEILKRQVALLHGYGTHRQLHPTRVLKAAGLAANPSRSPPPAVVLHLVDPDSISSASLDYYLETELASKHPGTIFMRSGGRSTLLLDAAIATKAFGNRLQADRDMPALVTIRDGVVTNICPCLQQFVADEGGPIEPHAVEMWLQQSGVLRSQPPMFDTLCYIRPEEEALMDYLAHKKPDELVEEPRFNCGLNGCHKTFPHEHVGVKTSEQNGLVLNEEDVLGVDAK